MFPLRHHNPKWNCEDWLEGASFRLLSSRKLALLGVPKCRRSAICLTESVVSLRSRWANWTLSGSCFRRAARSASCHPRRPNSSAMMRSALACVPDAVAQSGVLLLCPRVLQVFAA